MDKFMRSMMGGVNGDNSCTVIDKNQTSEIDDDDNDGKSPADPIFMLLVTHGNIKVARELFHSRER